MTFAVSHSSSNIRNALSVDVEDYFQVQAFDGVYRRQDWDNCEHRVVRNTDILLDIWNGAGVKGTFFTLGWVGERYPDLIKRIAAAGHEVASHGYCHARVDSQTPEEFRADIRRTKALLEDISGTPVRGYRAATFSVGPKTTPWAWQVLEEEGHAYSSSIYPVKGDFYANADMPRAPYIPAGASSLIEIPISTFRFGARNLPCGGGGYFRFLPYTVSKAALAHLNRVEQMSAVFYIHPWEVDPDQPRPDHAPLKSRLRHYMNLKHTHARLSRLVRDFAWDRMDRVFNLDQPAHQKAS